MVRILKVDQSGIPEQWVSAQEAAGDYADGSVAWFHGDVAVTLRGGINRASGLLSTLDIHPIFAVKGAKGTKHRLASTPSFSNQGLFQRDRMTCGYCGVVHVAEALTCDHIVPISKGGRTTWANVVSACRGCNARKGAQSLEQLGWKLLFVPYVPDLYEGLILEGRNILASQHEYLSASLPKHSRLQ